MRRALTILAGVTFLGLLLMRPDGEEVARAEGYVVTKTTDSAGTCTPADCSLREAILAANANPGFDTVTVPAGTYVLTLAGADENGGMTGDLDITDDMEILGAGANLVEVDGNGLDRVFEIHNAEVRIQGIRITGGLLVQAGGGERGGGGILNLGVLELRSVWVYANTSEAAPGHEVASGTGGGVFNAGHIWIVDSMIFWNTGRRGSAIFHTGGGFVEPNMLVERSSVIWNDADVAGAIVMYQSGEIVNSTISGNRAEENSAGVVVSAGTLKLTNVTIADNDWPAGFGGKALNVDPGMAMAFVANSILAADGSPCQEADQAAIVSQGHNIATDESCGFGVAGDMSSTDPLLRPLADNGGPSLTHDLLFRSPARDNGDGALCKATDQRGVPRDDGACDIGALEAAPVPPLPFGGAVPGVAKN